MLASSNLSKTYIETANFVNVDSSGPPVWYQEMTKKSGVNWMLSGSRGDLYRPGFVFLTNKGEYMCTMTGIFNNYTHALNLIREVKVLSQDATNRVSREFRDCPGSQI